MRTLALLITIATVTACRESSDVSAVGEPSAIAAVAARIGAVDGPDEYVFGRVTGVAATRSHIYIADYQADVVRAYDWNGTYLFTVASRGAGPGEVRRPCCLAVDSLGQLWVRDTGNQRYNAYQIADGASFVRSIRMVHSSANLFVTPGFLRRDLLVDVGSTIAGDGESVRTRFVLNTTGAIERRDVIPTPPVDSVPVHHVTRKLRGGVARYTFYQPFGPMHLMAYGPWGSWATAVSSNYQVRWIGASNAFDTVVTAPMVGEPVTSFERDSARAAWREQLQRGQLSPNDFPFDVAATKPVLRYLQFDAGGRLWVHLTPGRVGPNIARVHDPGGGTIGTVTWPRDVDLRFGFIMDGAAFGIHMDSLGVHRVVRMTF